MKKLFTFLSLVLLCFFNLPDANAQCEAVGGLISTQDATTICAGDGQADPINVTLDSNMAANSGWVITDTNGVILGLPPAPPFDLDGAGIGVCLIWHLSYEDGLTGLAIGDSVSNLDGCYDFSNEITVTRYAGTLDGGAISTIDPTTICAGDGIADPINVDLVDATGTNMAWVITDTMGNILGLPPGPPFNLEGAGAGVCVIWNLSYENGLLGLNVRNNVANLQGCYALSNGIPVTRNEVNGGHITALSGQSFHRAVIANRASGTISVINTETNEVESTHTMPENGEPMYVVYSAQNNTVLVGDYNGKVVAFDGKDFSVRGSAIAGAGVFHMWLSPDGRQLWVNNELDKTISVINPRTLNTLTTFSIPQDLLEDGYKPHDVILMPNNSAAFVTMLGPLANDYVVKYDTRTFEETARTAVGTDPHVSLTAANDKLYVASQGSNELKVLNRSDLTEVTILTIPNAHGLGMNTAGTHLYVSNISDGGTNAVYTMDLTADTLVGSPVDAPFTAPHNFAVTYDDNKLFVTHSGGANNQVSIYNLDPSPVYETSVEVGNNPFGLVTYTYTESSTDVTICAGDAESDAFDVDLFDNIGENSNWVITDTNGMILGLPISPPFDLEGAGLGVCQIWHLSSNGMITGLMMGNSVSDISGCFNLSNPITVTRYTGTNDGGIITTTDPTTICAGDGVDDPINVMLDSAIGSNMAWVITDTLGNILGLPAGSPFNLEGAGSGVCVIWNLSFEDGLKGAQVGNNVANLEGCYDLSNGIAVTRNGVDGGSLTGLTGKEFHRAVIANRASGTISVIDSETNEIESTHAMPDNGEPMYVVYNKHNNTVLVGDYNGKVIGFDGSDFSIVGSADAGAGVFHMWLSPDGQQLWVNNELDKTISVIDPSDMTTLTTFPIPRDLLDAGYKPHDVILMPNNAAAFVTMLGPLTEDYVVKYSTTTFLETDRAAVGHDPHVSVTAANDKLYVASQGSSELKVLNRSDLSEVTTLSVPNAHGLGMNPAGTYLYISNISQGGVNAIYTMDLATNMLVGSPVNAPFAVPHNFSVTDDNLKLFVTHSGATNDKVSIYSLSPIPSLNTFLTVGNNPFGLATYSYTETSNEFVICAGDNRSDAFDVVIDGNVGTSSWIITDTAGMILGLPMNPPFDLDGAGVGICQIWHMSSNGTVNGLMVGNSVANLDGCFDLSNPITVTRYTGMNEGGTISTTDPTTICAGDGVADPINVMLDSASGTNMAWVITDFDGNILGLPLAPPFDLEGAGDGVCVIWNLSFEDGLVGVAVGNHIDDLQGCYALSNGIIVTRNGVDGGDLSLLNGDVEVVICAGDGAADPLEVSLLDDVGVNSHWVITDTNGMILGLPMAPPFDLDGAGIGVCLIWHLSSLDTLPGLAVGNAVADLTGCYDLSNEIRVTRYSGTTDGGIITTTDPTTICAGDGAADPINVDVSAAVGTNGGWIITDTLGNILGLPMAPPFDLDGAGVGVCQIWYIGYENGLVGMNMGANISGLQGCYDLSNAIDVTRYAGETDGGTISTTDPTEICAGDGMPDPIDVSITGAIGTNGGWIITDTLGNILGLPMEPPFDLDGAGVGVCEIWYIRYEDGLLGKTMGANVNGLLGCYDLSNQITVTRDTSGAICNSGSRDFSNDLGIEVYPNLTSDLINIDARDINENLQISITDISGRQLFNQEFIQQNNLIPIRVSSYVNGTYILQLATATGTQQVKFIKVD